MIFLILLAGLILRLVSLNQSLWLDEATSALTAKMSLSDIFTKFLPGDFHPPLYYLILKYWVVFFGNSEISLRIPSIIFGLVSVYIIYQIGKKLFNGKTGLVASALFATSGLSVYYSQEARMYMMAAFLATLSVYLFINKKWVLFSLTLLLMGMTDYVSLFILPIFIFADIKGWRRTFKNFIPLILGFLVWMPAFIKQFSGGLSVQGTSWWKILGTASFKNIALIPIKFILGRINFENAVVYALIVGICVLLFGYLLFKSQKEAKLIWFWLIFPVLIGIIVSFKIPALTYFRFLFCLPAFYILAANGAAKTGIYQKPVLVLIILINLFSTIYYLGNLKFQREDWRSAAKTVDGDVIIFPASSQKEALIYYGKGSQITDVYSFSGKESQVWLSRYVTEIVDPGDSSRIKLETLGYNKASEYNFNGVVFWKYIKNKYAYLY